MRQALKKVQTETKEATKDWAAERKQLKAEGDEMRRKVARLTDELARATRSLAASEVAVAKATRESNARLEKGELPAPPLGADDVTVALAALNQELVNAKLKCAESEAERTRLRQELQMLRIQSNIKPGAPAPSPDEIDASDKDANPDSVGCDGGGAANDVEGTRHAFDSMEARLDARSMTLELEDCRRNLAAAQADAAREATARESVASKLAVTEAEAADEAKRAAQATEALAVLTKEQSILEDKLSSLKERNGKAKEVVLKQQAERKQLLASQKELETRLTASFKEIEKANGMHAEAHRAFEKTKLSLAEAVEKGRAIAAGKKEAEASLKSLRLEYDTIKASYEKLGAAGAKMRNNLQSTRERLAAEQEACRAAKEEVGRLSAELSQLSSTRQRAELEVMQVREESEDAVAAHDAMRIKVSALERELAAARTASMQKDLQLMEVQPDQIKRVAEERDALQAEVSLLRARCTQHALDISARDAALQERERAWEMERCELERQVAALQRGHSVHAPGVAHMANDGWSAFDGVSPDVSSQSTSRGHSVNTPGVAHIVDGWSAFDGVSLDVSSQSASLCAVGSMTVEAMRSTDDLHKRVSAAERLLSERDAEVAALTERLSVALQSCVIDSGQPGPQAEQAATEEDRRVVVAREAAAAATAEAAAAAARETALREAIAGLEAEHGELAAELAGLREEMANGEEARKAKAVALKHKTQAYIAQLTSSHEIALANEAASAEEARREARDTKLNLERISDAAASSIAELQARLTSAERATAAAAQDAMAMERESARPSPEALRPDLPQHHAAYDDAATHACRRSGSPTVATGTAPSSARDAPVSDSPAELPVGQDALTVSAGSTHLSALQIELGALKEALRRSQSGRASEVLELTAAFEREAAMQSDLQLERDRCVRELEALRSEIATLKCAAGKMAGGAAERTAAQLMDDPTANLSVDEMRAEMSSQSVCIIALDEALAAAEARIKELERWRDLHGDADSMVD